MKTVIRSLIGLCLLFNSHDIICQELTYTQKGLSYSKGMIDTDVLIELIRAKQKELNKFVLRRIITKTWISPNVNEKEDEKKTRVQIENFTTKFLIYSSMNELILSGEPAEFGEKTIAMLKETAMIYGIAIAVNENFIDTANIKKTIKAKDASITVDYGLNEDPEKFNLKLDIVLDICITNPELQKYFPFYSQLADDANENRKWYEIDSRYYPDREGSAQATYNFIKGKIDLIITHLKQFQLEWNKPGTHDFNYIMDTLPQLLQPFILKSISDLKIWNETEIVTSLKNLGSPKDVTADFTNLMDHIKTLKFNSEFLNLVAKTRYDLRAFINLAASKPDIKVLEGAIREMEQLANRTETVRAFFKAITTTIPSNGLTQLSLNEQQFKAVKDLIAIFIRHIDNNGKYNTPAVYLQTIVDNISYTPKNPANNNPASISLSFESVLLNLDKKLLTPSRLEQTRNFQPFLIIGINSAAFLRTNTLDQINDTSSTSMKSLLFASEKIGFKYKVINRKYTRSFNPGVVYKYHGKYYTWKRPQQKAIIDDWHFEIHTGGLLYNLVNLKTNKNFNFPFVGIGTGIQFFNGLTASISYNRPYTENTFNRSNDFLLFSIDVPIIEYISNIKR